MQDVCKVDMDTCVAYISLPSEEHPKLFTELNSLLDVIINLEET